MSPFHHLLANNLIANITNFTVWFAVTFWVFLETRSVLATGMVAGIYLALTAGLGIWFGSLVDHHRKKSVMMASSAVSLALYAASLAASMLVPEPHRRGAGRRGKGQGNRARGHHHECGRAPVGTPVTGKSRMPSSA